jgi:hypothetical protein
MKTTLAQARNVYSTAGQAGVVVTVRKFGCNSRCSPSNFHVGLRMECELGNAACSRQSAITGHWR